MVFNNNNVYSSNNLPGSNTGYANVSLGLNTYNNANNTGGYNVAIGTNNMQGAVTGESNFTVGMNSLLSLTSGSYNNAMGFNSLNGLTTGSYNTAAGMYSGNSDNYNKCTYLGYNANGATADNQVIIGDANSTTFINNLNVKGTSNINNGLVVKNGLNVSGGIIVAGNINGSESAPITFGGDITVDGVINNTALTDTFKNSLKLNNNENVYINNNDNNSNTGGANYGSRNIAIGNASLQQNQSGTNNIALGYHALVNNYVGSNNIALGNNAGWSDNNNNCVYIGNNVSGSTDNNQILLGNSLSTTIVNNLKVNGTTNSIGNVTMNNLTVNGTISNTGITNLTNSLNNALQLDSSKLNIIIPNNNQPNTNNWYGNVAIGINALYGNHGASNIGIGDSALYNNASGRWNIGIGENALLNNVSGLRNIALGYNSLTGVSNVNDNTCIGNNSGTDCNFNNCTFIGANANGATYQDQVIIGSENTTAFVGSGGVVTRSDLRDKADIRDTLLGLDFIEKLHPVDYRFNHRKSYIEHITTTNTKREEVLNSETGLMEIKDVEYKETVKVVHENDGSKKQKEIHHGLIAQEVKQVIKDTGVEFGGLVDHDFDEKNGVMSIGYTELIGPLIKAVQELSLEVKLLKEKLNAK